MPNWESAQELRASAAETTSAAGAAVDLGARDRLLRQTLAVSAASGATPTLDVRLEASADGLTGWRTIGTFARATAAAVEKLSFIAPERYVRVAWTIGGATPSFTFAVGGTKGLVYASLEDLDAYGMPGAALAKLAPSKRAEAIAAASTKAEGKLALRYDLPLVTWGVDLTEAVSKIASYDLLSVRGFNPDGSDENVRTRHNDAWKWLTEVADGKCEPIGVVDTSPEVEDDGVVVVTHAPRGWR